MSLHMIIRTKLRADETPMLVDYLSANNLDRLVDSRAAERTSERPLSSNFFLGMHQIQKNRKYFFHRQALLTCHGIDDEAEFSALIPQAQPRLHLLNAP